MRSRGWFGYAAVFGMTVALAACSSGGSAKKAALPVPVTVPPTTVPPPVVITKSDPKLGTILADAQGLTLYTLTNKSGNAVKCDAACTAVWPPLDVPAGGFLPTGGPGVGTLGAAPGPTSSLIVTADALPLYRYTQDKLPADVKGEAITSFGGTWHVVKAQTEAASTTSSSSSTSTTKAAAAATTEPPSTEPASTEAPVETTVPADSIEPTTTVAG